MRAFPNSQKWGKLTPDEASSPSKESVDDAYDLH